MKADVTAGSGRIQPENCREKVREVRRGVAFGCSVALCFVSDRSGLSELEPAGWQRSSLLRCKMLDAYQEAADD